MTEEINFLLTNRIPRRLATTVFGWFSQIEQPIVRDLSIGLWKRCADLNLQEAKKTHFTSLHDCFTRELKEGVRPVDRRPEVIVSPCDAIVGASGTIERTTVLQTKGSPYTLDDLLCDGRRVERYRDGRYITLRLTSSMYHRFHAPADCTVDGITYISGDTWNVNPPALRRVERLFCKNERAVIDIRLGESSESLTLVPVAAILVASIRLKFLDVPLNLKYKGPNHIPCEASFRKGDEMGYFQHGSTIVVFATRDLELSAHVKEGDVIRMGQPLLHRR